MTRTTTTAPATGVLLIAAAEPVRTVSQVTAMVEINPVPQLMDGAAVTDAWLGPDPASEREQLRADAVEQLMRMSDDEDLVLGLLGDQSTASATVGRILATLRPQLVPGCPLLAYGARRPLDNAWRRWYPPAPSSLYAELRFYRTLAGLDPTHPAGDHPDAYAELEELRDTLDVLPGS